MSTNEFVPKLFTMVLQGIPRKQLLRDLSAGIIVGIIALPLAIAFAIASGVSPEKGIITAIVGGLIISLFGGSRVQIGGPTGAFIVIIYSIIATHGFEGLLTATFMAGVMLIVFGLLKMGSLLKYIPQTLIIGFTTAIAVIIFTTQINDLFGMNIEHLPGDFLGKWGAYAAHLSDVNLYALLIGLFTILMIVFMPAVAPKVPWTFAAIVLTSAAVWFFRLPVDTIHTRYGTISFAMPQLQHMDLSLDSVRVLFVPAVSIAILGALESLLSAVVSDGMIGGKHRSNMELIAQGAANVILPLIGGIPATGAIARTAANIKNGGRTPVAGIVHALFLLLVYLFAMPIITYIPMATLAGVLIVVAWNMSELDVFFSSLRINCYESLVLLTTFFLTILIDLTVSIPVGFVLSTILFMKRMSDSIEIAPLLTTKQSDDTLFSAELGSYSDRIAIFELNGPMFFGSAHNFVHITEKSHDSCRCVILRFRYVPIIDTSALHRLKTIHSELHKRHCELVISGANEKIRDKLISLGIIDADHIHGDTLDALKYAEYVSCSST
ncbi:MAG: STAS domain-containing protein [Spirochaetia bacterium]|nr:STAS domain-containing protein [Spirochaetia bacterium]